MSERTNLRQSLGKPGRRSKGDRAETTVRFPKPMKARLKAKFRKAGYDGISDYVVDIVARAEAAGLWETSAPGEEQQSLALGA
jgi:hypothetical protein